MKQVTIHEAKTHLSRLIQEVLQGEEIVIARGSEPLVRLVPLQTPPRVPGTYAGRIWMADDFDAPLEDFREYME